MARSVDSSRLNADLENAAKDASQASNFGELKNSLKNKQVIRNYFNKRGNSFAKKIFKDMIKSLDKAEKKINDCAGKKNGKEGFEKNCAECIEKLNIIKNEVDNLNDNDDTILANEQTQEEFGKLVTTIVKRVNDIRETQKIQKKNTMALVKQLKLLYEALEKAKDTEAIENAFQDFFESSVAKKFMKKRFSLSSKIIKKFLKVFNECKNTSTFIKHMNSFFNKWANSDLKFIPNNLKGEGKNSQRRREGKIALCKDVLDEVKKISDKMNSIEKTQDAISTSAETASEEAPPIPPRPAVSTSAKAAPKPVPRTKYPTPTRKLPPPPTSRTSSRAAAISTSAEAASKEAPPAPAAPKAPTVSSAAPSTPPRSRSVPDAPPAPPAPKAPTVDSAAPSTPPRSRSVPDAPPAPPAPAAPKAPTVDSAAPSTPPRSRSVPYAPPAPPAPAAPKAPPVDSAAPSTPPRSRSVPYAPPAPPAPAAPKAPPVDSAAPSTPPRPRSVPDAPPAPPAPEAVGRPATKVIPSLLKEIQAGIELKDAQDRRITTKPKEESPLARKLRSIRGAVEYDDDNDDDCTDDIPVVPETAPTATAIPEAPTVSSAAPSTPPRSRSIPDAPPAPPAPEAVGRPATKVTSSLLKEGKKPLKKASRNPNPKSESDPTESNQEHRDLGKNFANRVGTGSPQNKYINSEEASKIFALLLDRMMKNLNSENDLKKCLEEIEKFRSNLSSSLNWYENKNVSEYDDLKSIFDESQKLKEAVETNDKNKIKRFLATRNESADEW